MSGSPRGRIHKVIICPRGASPATEKSMKLAHWLRTILQPQMISPKCNKPIHARLQSHAACGWAAETKAENASGNRKVGARRRVVRRSAAGSGTITLADISAVKAVVEKLGADKVRQLAEVLAK
jgi:hypothetical protein